MPTMPARPRMPDDAEEAASIHTRTRQAMLTEDWSDVAKDWNQLYIGKRRAQRWGPPDTSINPLQDISRQLTTPGLYGARPDVAHRAERNDGLIGVGGILDLASVWTRLQHVQFLAMGLGDYWVRPGFDVVTPYLSLVSPADLHLVPHPVRQGEVIELWHLRLRFWVDKKAWVYTWDCYNASPDAPSFRVVEARPDGSQGDDLTSVFLPGLEGYPWRFADGTPYIPYQRYQAADTGQVRNVYLRRGVHIGTLNAAMFGTFAGRAALDASGSTTLVFNAEMPSSDVREAGAQPVSSLDIEPGAMFFLQGTGDRQPSATSIGAGVNLATLDAYVASYLSRLASQYGLSGADLERNSGTHTSGFALMVSERGKRMVQRQVTPLFRAADLRLIRMFAALARDAGAGDYDELGYAITYQEIEDSPQERRETRDQMTWELQQGLLSPVEAYQQLHPGATREMAIDALQRAASDRALVAAASERPTPSTTPNTTSQE